MLWCKRLLSTVLGLARSRHFFGLDSRAPESPSPVFAATTCVAIRIVDEGRPTCDIITLSLDQQAIEGLGYPLLMPCRIQRYLNGKWRRATLPHTARA